MGIMKAWRWFSRTQVWRAWQRFGNRRGNRLAGATTFFAFLSLFPLITLAAAIVGSLLGDRAIEALKNTLDHNLPGIADRIDVDGLVSNAGTIGLISAVSLLFTGLLWIDSLRASIRSMHELDDQPGNFVQRKLADLAALVGLGLIGLISTGASSILTGLSARIVDAANWEGSWLASWGIDLVSVVVGIAAGAILFLYLQTALPRIMLPRKVALIAALAGGVLFYLAQKLGNLYVTHVIGANAAYGALALPLALLVWIYLLTRALMVVAAWTKEATLDAAAREATDEGRLRIAEEPLPPELSVQEPLLPGPPGKRYKVVPVPQKKADTVSVAAGAVLGITAVTLVSQLAKAARTFRR
ncbi:YihY/virulence factor BrkB family protein [Kribbella pittospori]|uniref:YihY/virulence factor BrkB family protein n=1 Tax=Kribbella pittospori TaxID=722689 RepID=A0A4R0KW76_9ACTN|nr:YihY/virulence factor BrkB family protein [Kribbella pittospori]TCC64367.1 YihY/virulence factor BrkB family protein [Kribbella pittospori]